MTRRQLGTFFFCRQSGTLLWCRGGQLKEPRPTLATRGRDERLLAQDQRYELVLGVHHVVGAGGF